MLRPSFVFGADGGALPRFLRLARLAPVTLVLGPGTQRVQPIWIDDVVRAVRLAVDAEPVEAPVELGGPEAVTWNDLWRRLKEALGTRRPAINVPFWLARGPAALLERMPSAPLTRDQLRMLEGPDNVVTDGGASMRRLGLGELVALDEQLRRAVLGRQAPAPQARNPSPDRLTAPRARERYIPVAQRRTRDGTSVEPLSTAAITARSASLALADPSTRRRAVAVAPRGSPIATRRRRIDCTRTSWRR